jgi:hypothetical protein
MFIIENKNIIFITLYPFLTLDSPGGSIIAIMSAEAMDFSSV